MFSFNCIFLVFFYLFLQLPVDIESLSPEERQRHLIKRKPKQVVQIVDDFEDDYDIERYSHLWKK